ncbi:helix-turn-helix domain-containing protein [Sorangium sp. So ce1000]|uniref:helix-turn-helix domain-containing protein n=1 Tax=Sorangium sp. So ce1000 TaxID=3133325 RepID=UPI003F6165EF
MQATAYATRSHAVPTAGDPWRLCHVNGRPHPVGHREQVGGQSRHFVLLNADSPEPIALRQFAACWLQHVAPVAAMTAGHRPFTAGEVLVTTALPISTPIAPSSSHSTPAACSLSVPSAAPAARSAHLPTAGIAAPSYSAQPPRERATATVASRSTPPPRSAAPLPRSTSERILLGRDRIRNAAEAGQRIRSYEVALDLDLSEFHFARLFRAAFGSSPHVYYDEVRAERARALLCEGLAEGEVARRIGFRRPAELRALLSKRGSVPPSAGETEPSDASAE